MMSSNSNINLLYCVSALAPSASGRETRQQPPPGGGPAFPPAETLQKGSSEDQRLGPRLRGRSITFLRERHLQSSRQPADQRQPVWRWQEESQPQRRPEEVCQKEVRSWRKRGHSITTFNVQLKKPHMWFSALTPSGWVQTVQKQWNGPLNATLAFLHLWSCCWQKTQTLVLNHLSTYCLSVPNKF